jgi:4'-phosphopantetheinyl transferase
VVDVWRADLAAASDELGELLCAEERERAARIVRERDRVLWARSRGVLRALLGRYLDRDPRALRFAVGAHGKPMLQIPGGTPTSGPTPAGTLKTDGVADLRFNMSHSGELALYAVTAKHAVGIDVEVARRQINELAIVARVLGRDQARRLASLDAEARTQEFLRAWATNEAAVKCRGTGLAAPPQGSPTADLWTTELDVGPHAAAAVAVEGERRELRCWQWRS